MLVNGLPHGPNRKHPRQLHCRRPERAKNDSEIAEARRLLGLCNLRLHRALTYVQHRGLIFSARLEWQWFQLAGRRCGCSQLGCLTPLCKKGGTAVGLDDARLRMRPWCASNGTFSFISATAPLNNGILHSCNPQNLYFVSSAHKARVWKKEVLP